MVALEDVGPAADFGSLSLGTAYGLVFMSAVFKTCSNGQERLPWRGCASRRRGPPQGWQRGPKHGAAKFEWRSHEAPVPLATSVPTGRCNHFYSAAVELAMNWSACRGGKDGALNKKVAFRRDSSLVLDLSNSVVLPTPTAALCIH